MKEVYLHNGKELCRANGNPLYCPVDCHDGKELNAQCGTWCAWFECDHGSVFCKREQIGVLVEDNNP